MTKPLNTQNAWIILTLTGAVGGFCLVSLDVKENTETKAMSQSSLQRDPYCYSFHEANICGLQVRNENKLIKVKSETSPLLQIDIHHQMCNLPLIQNQHAPPNVESRPYYKSICTTCEDLNQGPSACKVTVQTTTPPGLDTILIEQQAIILPRMFKPSWLSTYK